MYYKLLTKKKFFFWHTSLSLVMIINCFVFNGLLNVHVKVQNHFFSNAPSEKILYWEIPLQILSSPCNNSSNLELLLSFQLLILLVLFKIGVMPISQHFEHCLNRQDSHWGENHHIIINFSHYHNHCGNCL